MHTGLPGSVNGLYDVYVVRLAIDSKAGKEGFFILIIGLMAGVFGFLLKLVIQYVFENSL